MSGNSAELPRNSPKLQGLFLNRRLKIQHSHYHLLLFLLFVSDLALATTLEQLTNRIKCLDQSPKYRKRPDQAVEVEVEITIISIAALNLEKMELKVEIFLEQAWKDYRCHFKPLPRQESEITLQGHGLEKRMDHLWLPDTYIINAKQTQSHQTPQPQQSTKISFDGLVTHNQRLTVSATCPMDLRLFPMDKQMCSLIIESYSFSASKVKYWWRDNSTLKFLHSSDYQEKMMPELSLLGYRLTTQVNKIASYQEDGIKKKAHKPGDDKKSRLVLDLFFERPMGHYMFNLYFPAIFIVFMSWINFWLNRSATPARVTLGVTTVLTITTLMANADSNLPKTSYPKAIGVYLYFCFVFTFSALIEYSVASWMDKRVATVASAKQSSLISRSIPAVGLMFSSTEEVTNEPDNLENGKHCRRDTLDVNVEPPRHLRRHTLVDINSATAPARLRKRSYISTKLNDPKLIEHLSPSSVDLYSRLLFPATFILFNICYWTLYLTLVESSPEDIIVFQHIQ